MNEKIDLTKILKDCPKDWKFYSTIYGNVTFYRIEHDCCYPIVFFFIDKNKIERYRGVTEQGLNEHDCNGECTLFPSKDQRDWSKFTAPWYKKEKFDPKTLKPFDRVLVRDRDIENWMCNLFSHIINDEYLCIGSCFIYCIPYNDDTKHLVGTKEEAPEYYRYWED